MADLPTPIAASSIASNAFRLMKLAPLSSFQDDSEQANDAREFYPVAKAMVLAANDWSFASELVALPEATAPTEGTFAADPNLPNLYELPADCVKLRDVLPETVRWRVDRKYLRADQATALTIRYTQSVAAEARMPREFQVAMSYQLAVLMAPRWVADLDKQRGLKSDLAAALEGNSRADARQAKPERLDGRDGSYSDDWLSQVMR